ncbi:DUF1799 domain-containing protein [Chromobacterium violaceum]|uniref:DUF1799 domain-containing protein n=1 Tax=Chromobacterium violaceum TaxID=536 RepID=UPI001E50182B|nr:DUF1799 domain-containing protein [Chromobacterium violaceum]MCD0494821.1 DUF1799 domain-containing protein [Chromobacterium violaceum]
MRWQFGERAATQEENRRALLDAGVPTDQIDALLPAASTPEAFELLAEALPVWRVWQGMQTQWRVGAAGAYGLDYCAMPVVEARCGVALDGEMFEALQAMEREALRLMSRKGE